MITTPNRLISFLTDYGFKITFANEKNKTFLKKAVQLLMKTPMDIKSIQHLPTEFEGITEDARKGFYDTLCMINKDLYFIIEMQVGNYKFLMERILFYVSQLYISQILKGKTGFKNIKKVHCICITKDAIIEDSPEFYHKANFRTENGALFMDNVEIILVELEKFNKLVPDIDNELDELLFTMKNAHTFDVFEPEKIPHFWKKPWLQEVIKELNFSTMSPLNRALYNISVAQLIAVNEQAEIDDAKRRRKMKREVRQEVTQEVTEEVTHKVTEEVTHKVTEEVTHKVTEEVTHKVTEEVTHKVTEEVTHKVTEEVTHKAIKKLLSLGKLSVQDIADSQEVEVSYVLKIKAILDINLEA
jgi:predicted transposase/invertase (TIGR01784 family)